jgi:hypothetical protein
MVWVRIVWLISSDLIQSESEHLKHKPVEKRMDTKKNQNDTKKIQNHTILNKNDTDWNQNATEMNRNDIR